MFLETFRNIPAGTQSYATIIDRKFFPDQGKLSQIFRAKNRHLELRDRNGLERIHTNLREPVMICAGWEYLNAAGTMVAFKKMYANGLAF